MVWIPVSEHFNINTSNTPVRIQHGNISSFISAKPHQLKIIFLLCITKLHVAKQGLESAGRYLELVQTAVILQEMIAWKYTELVSARDSLSL